MDFFDRDALLTVTSRAVAKEPFAFVVGSALSRDASGGVPGVTEMLELVRAEIGSTAPGRLARFESEVTPRTGTDAYQAAMAWARGNLTEDAVNRVVQSAVLKARRPGAPSDFDRDGTPDEWYLPEGTLQLARLVTEANDRFPGPIFTTNFDPLLSLAVDAAGGKFDFQVLDSDGSLRREVERTTGAVGIVHLHGYWRGSDTLHTPSQLSAPRLQLTRSLQRLLERHSLIVAGYGGWDDVLTRALADLCQEPDARPTILWCFHEGDPAVITARYKRLLSGLETAIIRGRFVGYAGIDCHSIFSEMGNLPPAPAAATTGVGASRIAGWEEVDAAGLASLRPLQAEELIRYFDGAVPTWRHAVSDEIPRLQAVSELSERLRIGGRGDSQLQLVRAAGGEGKSTVLLQVAADAARSGDWRVLWRPSPGVGLPPGRVASLDPAQKWLLVADDADNVVSDLAASARLLHEKGRTNVALLLAARDADWKSAGGDRPPWEQWLDRKEETWLGGITPTDARALVDSWQRCGPAGLRQLARLSAAEDRSAALEAAIRDAPRSPGDGSLFGGLLTVRFGQDGLQAHVRDFLNRLSEMPIETGGATLFDALLYVAACHGARIDGIDQNVLADLVGVPRHWVHRRVVLRLGAEAAAVRSASQVTTRHSKVASAVLVEAERSFGIDLAEVWSEMVRQTAATSGSVRVSPAVYARIVHAGPRLLTDLPRQLPRDRRAEIAIAAAKASTEALPERLDCIVDVCRAYRSAGQSAEAVQTCRESFPHTYTKVDYRDVIRGYLYEWSVCEGNLGEAGTLANVWLAGLSLSDDLNPAPLTRRQAGFSCVGLGVTLGKLAEHRDDCPYARGRRAAAYLGRLTRSDTRGVGNFDKYDREADELGTPHPGDVAEAVAWLTSSVAAAGRALQDPLLTSIVRPEAVSFGTLQAVLSP